MNKSPLFSYYSRAQRSAIFSLIGLMAVLQIGMYFLKNPKPSDLNIDEIAMAKVEEKLDSIAKAREFVLTSFNPNFITDYRGYVLGMTETEIDKLHAYRAQGKYVNSAKEFQQITGVTDEWLSKHQSYFKFPQFASNAKNYAEVRPKRKDINTISYDGLVAIKGIGDYSARKIINERDKFGGFVDTKQFRFIENLPADVYAILNKNFFIGQRSKIDKINLNRANIKDLQRIPYVDYKVARSIVVYRSKQNVPINEKDLQQIPDFPMDKFEIITLYLGDSN